MLACRFVCMFVCMYVCMYVCMFVVTAHRPQFAYDLHQTWSTYVVRSISYVYSFWWWWRHRWRQQDPKHFHNSITLNGYNSINIWARMSCKGSKCRGASSLCIWCIKFSASIFMKKFVATYIFHENFQFSKSRNFHCSLKLTSDMERPYTNYLNKSNFISITSLMTSQHDDKVAFYNHV